MLNAYIALKTIKYGRLKIFLSWELSPSGIHSEKAQKLCYIVAVGVSRGLLSS